MPWDDRIRRRLKLRDLDILMTVIDAGSMGKAAARFNMSQPAVSKLIADLEHLVGARLLERSRRGIEPTPQGLALATRGTAVFDELRQGVQELDFLSDPTSGEVRIGCTEPVGAAIVSPIIKVLSEQYPRMIFHVVAGDGPVLHAALAERKVELAICRVRGPIPPEQSVERLFDDRLVVATARNNPLTSRRRIQLNDLVDEPWLLPLDNEFGALVTDTFRASALAPPRLAVSTVSSSVRNELLATGRFLTIVPGFSLKLPRPHPILRALPVELPNVRHPLAIKTLKNRKLGAIARLFCERVRTLTKSLAKER
jgi:DNA-binding transcriptional LysR family regulator